jgi:hypothetical protein
MWHIFTTSVNIYLVYMDKFLKMHKQMFSILVY